MLQAACMALNYTEKVNTLYWLSCEKMTCQARIHDIYMLYVYGRLHFRYTPSRLPISSDS
jgi:hypothetical protein